MLSTTITNRADPQICKQCKGLCCQGHPGVWIDPLRFLTIFSLPKPRSVQELKANLPSSDLVIRDIDGVAIPAPRKFQHGCVFLGADGCQLAEDVRPCQCLALTPSIDTLVEGEILCSLPPYGSTSTARRCWAEFWQNIENS